MRYVRSMKIFMLALFLSCSTPPTLSTVSSRVTSSRGCFDPADYGAIPDDLIDDRAPLQAALDAASAVGGAWCLGAGRWEVSRAVPPTYNRFAALNTHGHHVSMRGAGPATVISLRGDQGAATTWVIALDPGAGDILIGDLTIDTSLATNTEEQTHAIEVGSGVCLGAQCLPIEDVRFDRVRIVHPAPALPALKGDCLRLAGTTVATQVKRVTVIGSTFTGCARSGIAIQRNVHGLEILGNQFTAAGDQDIDSEPTGTAADLNDSTLIVGNVFADVGGQGDVSVSIGGTTGLSPMGRVVLANNVFEGRGINVYRARDVAITGNTINATMVGAYGVLELGSTIERVIIGHNTIHRIGTAGPVIRVIGQSGYHASDLTIDGNVTINDTAGDGIYMESVSDATITNNSIRFAPSVGRFGIYLRSVIAPADSLLLIGNRIVGPVAWGIYLAASPQQFGDVTLVGNQVRAATTGLRCDSSTVGNFRSPFVVAANRLGAIAGCAGLY